MNEPAIFPLIPYLLLLTGTVSAINIYIGFEYNRKELFGKVINAFSIFVFFHAFYVFYLENFCIHERWLDRMMPFIFVYGPFLYFALRAMKGKTISTVRVLIHLIPFAIFFVIFIHSAIYGWHKDLHIFKPVMRISSLFSVCSLLGYTFTGIFSNGSNAILHMKRKRNIVLVGGIMMLFVSMFFIAVSISIAKHGAAAQSSYVFRTTIYTFMLIITVLILGYLKNTFLKVYRANGERSLDDALDKDAEATPLYAKSKLSDLQLQEYTSRLNDLMDAQKPYLDPSLSLENLALQLKIPAHHLTQTLNLQLQTNFTSFVNKHRIAYACHMLDNKSGSRLTIEQLALASGFNSKISFNRNFKLLVGLTPSEYLQQVTST